MMATFQQMTCFCRFDCAIDIFEHKMNGFVTGLFLFDNAPSHQNEPLMLFLHRRCQKDQTRAGHVIRWA